MKIILAVILSFILVVELRRTPPPRTTTTKTTTATAGDDDNDDVVNLVKSYIDAGTCNTVTTGSSCGDSANSYYAEFEYNGQRVVIVNGIPDHDAENDQFVVNPNTRCERWTFMTIPMSVSKDSSTTKTDMGVVSLALTGGTFYNQLSSPAGDVALPNEGQSLDSCAGHSSENSQYHYHANILCDDDAADASVCKQVGWSRDGVPVYGFCNDASGNQFASCYSVKDGSTESEVVISAGTFQSADSASDYEYVDSDDCNLDKANGAIHPETGVYSYFMTETYPWVPCLYYGDGGVADLCSAA